MSTLVITHAGCSDGFASAWVLNKVYPLARFIPGVHGAPPPDVTDYDVVIADFSYHRETLLEMEKRARSIVVLDHHVTAQEELRGLDFCVFDMDKSGASLTWDHHFPDLPRPGLVNYVEDRDLWKHALPNTHEVAAVVQATPFEFGAWDALADRFDKTTPSQELVQDGRAILAVHARMEERIAGSKVEVVIAGFKVPAVNTPVLQSEMGHLLDEGAPFAVAWYVTGEGKVRFSLRSKDGGEDVGHIAKHFGGGGHPHSAGFELPMEDALKMFSLRGLT